MKSCFQLSSPFKTKKNESHKVQFSIQKKKKNVTTKINQVLQELYLI